MLDNSGLTILSSTNQRVNVREEVFYPDFGVENIVLGDEHWIFFVALLQQAFFPPTLNPQTFSGEENQKKYMSAQVFGL